VIFLYSFIISSQLGAGHRWIFFRLLGFDCNDQSCLHIFLRSSDKWYFVYPLASKVNCHEMSQHGNNRTNVWIEMGGYTQALSQLTFKYNYICLPDDFKQFPVHFWDRSILLQDVSLECDISYWNKMKQTICISRKYSCFTKNYGNNIDCVNDNATRE